MRSFCSATATILVTYGLPSKNGRSGVAGQLCVCVYAFSVQLVLFQRCTVIWHWLLPINLTSGSCDAATAVVAAAVSVLQCTTTDTTDTCLGVQMKIHRNRQTDTGSVASVWPIVSTGVSADNWPIELSELVCLCGGSLLCLHLAASSCNFSIRFASQSVYLNTLSLKPHSDDGEKEEKVSTGNLEVF